MGLSNAPAPFQELMNRAKRDIGTQQTYPFLDDQFTASVSIGENSERIVEVLRAGGLTIRMEKCKFLMGTYDDGLQIVHSRNRRVGGPRSLSQSTRSPQLYGLQTFSCNHVRHSSLKTFLRIFKPNHGSHTARISVTSIDG